MLPLARYFHQIAQIITVYLSRRCGETAPVITAGHVRVRAIKFALHLRAQTLAAHNVVYVWVSMCWCWYNQILLLVFVVQAQSSAFCLHSWVTATRRDALLFWSLDLVHIQSELIICKRIQIRESEETTHMIYKYLKCISLKMSHTVQN